MAYKKRFTPAQIEVIKLFERLRGDNIVIASVFSNNEQICLARALAREMSEWVDSEWQASFKSFADGKKVKIGHGFKSIQHLHSTFLVPDDDQNDN